MEKKIKMSVQQGELQPECKKIQDYIYRFCDLLGCGNFSKVFKAIHQHTSKKVAMKIIELSSLNNARLRELLNTETKILKMISHPNVIGCEEILSSARNCYIITELCNGGDLQKRLRTHGALKQKDLFQVAVDVYEGLKYLAKNNIVHRDIKLSNIFINEGVHKIADFGFAQIAENQFKDISVGSPIYMSPEGYINNIYGPKTDVWAFGVLLYELAQGKTPCNDCRSESELKSYLVKQIDASSFKSSISAQLKGLIIQCLQIGAAQRISICDIDHTQWMKRANKFVAQNQRKVNPAKETQHRKSVQLTAQFLTSIRERRASMNVNFSQFDKMSNLIKKQQQNLFMKGKKAELNENNRSQEDSENSDNSIEKDYSDQDSKRILNSPNTINLGLQKKTDDQQIKNIDRANLKSHKVQQKNQQNGVFSKGKSVWIQRSGTENAFQSNEMEQKNRKQNEIQKSGKIQSFENLRKLYNANPHHHSISVLAPLQSQEIKKQQSSSIINKSNSFEFPLNKILKVSNNVNRTTIQKRKSEKIDQSFTFENNSKLNFPNNSIKVIDRTLKYTDCINLIHYCRLCYKFAGLLEERASNQQAKHFLINWSVQLLQELNSKIDMWNSREPKQISSGLLLDEGKRQKLKQVAGEYLLKYSKSIKTSKSSTIREASSFIYNLYMNEGFLHSDRMQDKKNSSVYSALLCYLSVLDKQTRNLMQFTYQIKPTLEGRQMEKLLSVKITELNGRKLQELGFCEFDKENVSMGV